MSVIPIAFSLSFAIVLTTSCDVKNVDGCTSILGEDTNLLSSQNRITCNCLGKGFCSTWHTSSTILWLASQSLDASRTSGKHLLNAPFSLIHFLILQFSSSIFLKNTTTNKEPNAHTLKKPREGGKFFSYQIKKPQKYQQLIEGYFRKNPLRNQLVIRNAVDDMVDCIWETWCE